MADSLAKALFCDNIGSTGSNLHCCYIDKQNASVCYDNFKTSSPTFSVGCDNSSCTSKCQNPTWLYRSDNQDDASSGNIRGPAQRFQTCANVPTMAKFADQDALSDKIASLVGRHIPLNVPDANLSKVTTVVTECLTQTCKASRNHGACAVPCSPVKMLTSSTTPNLGGVNECLNTLCTGGYGSLPYANPDVVGIGVSIITLSIMLLWQNFE